MTRLCLLYIILNLNTTAMSMTQVANNYVSFNVYWCALESSRLSRPLGYERVYLPLCEVADTPFHIQGDDL